MIESLGSSKKLTRKKYKVKMEKLILFLMNDINENLVFALTLIVEYFKTIAWLNASCHKDNSSLIIK